MRFTRTVTGRSYAVAISEDELLSMMDRDRTLSPSLCEMLENIDGVENVNYDGHFGPYVFLTVETDHDSPATWDRIEKTIINYLED